MIDRLSKVFVGSEKFTIVVIVEDTLRFDSLQSTLLN